MNPNRMRHLYQFVHLLNPTWTEIKCMTPDFINRRQQSPNPSLPPDYQAPPSMLHLTPFRSNHTHDSVTPSPSLKLPCFHIGIDISFWTNVARSRQIRIYLGCGSTACCHLSEGRADTYRHKGNPVGRVPISYDIAGSCPAEPLPLVYTR